MYTKDVKMDSNHVKEKNACKLTDINGSIQERFHISAEEKLCARSQHIPHLQDPRGGMRTYFLPVVGASSFAWVIPR